MEHRPVLLCGLGKVGWRVLQSLQTSGAHVTAISLNVEADDPRLNGARLILGDCRQRAVLERAGIRSASGVVIVTSEDTVNVSTAMLARKLNPDCRIVVRMFNQNLLARLGQAVRNTVALSVSALTAPLMALTAITGESLAAFPIGDKPQQIARLQITADSPLLNLSTDAIAQKYKLLVHGHIYSRTQSKLLNELQGTEVMRLGDRIVLGGAPTSLQPLMSDAKDVADIGHRNLFFRLLRAVQRAVSVIDFPVRLVAFVLFSTLFVSTLVFRFGADLSWADGFYQSVSVTATGAELHGEDKPAWVKVYIGVLKLVGAALIAAFTAIVVNYLIKLRLAGTFELHRIPERGHVVVCGIGNIGFRCVEELVKLGYKVVAIEKEANSPFAATVRRMDVPVIIGDAAVPEVLKQAHVSTARAVIAASSTDLVNLEIALLVREVNATMRVVVRMNDPEFAQITREAGDIRYTVSPPALAAPAFAAALLGDRIQSLIYVGARSLAVVEFVAEAGDPITGRTLAELMSEFGLIPLGVSGKEPFAVRADIPTDHRVEVGQHITVLVELGKLDRLIVELPAKQERLE